MFIKHQKADTDSQLPLPSLPVLDVDLTRLDRLPI